MNLFNTDSDVGKLSDFDNIPSQYQSINTNSPAVCDAGPAVVSDAAAGFLGWGSLALASGILATPLANLATVTGDGTAAATAAAGAVFFLPPAGAFFVSFLRWIFGDLAVKATSSSSELSGSSGDPARGERDRAAGLASDTDRFLLPA